MTKKGTAQFELFPEIIEPAQPAAEPPPVAKASPKAKASKRTTTKKKSARVVEMEAVPREEEKTPIQTAPPPQPPAPISGDVVAVTILEKAQPIDPAVLAAMEMRHNDELYRRFQDRAEKNVANMAKFGALLIAVKTYGFYALYVNTLLHLPPAVDGTTLCGFLGLACLYNLVLVVRNILWARQYNQQRSFAFAQLNWAGRAAKILDGLAASALIGLVVIGAAVATPDVIATVQNFLNFYSWSSNTIVIPAP